MRFSTLIFVTLIPLINSEAIRQCLCVPYQKCLEGMKPEPLEKCFSRCERNFPTNGFMGCMKKFIPDFNRLKECSYSKKNGFLGCTSQTSNVLSERSMEDFRDLMIATIEENVSEFDKTRQFMNKKAARQAECVFECVYPGRNPCTRDLKCDIYLPPEEMFFEDFYECADRKKFFSKSEQMYNCISKLWMTNQNELFKRRKS